MDVTTPAATVTTHADCEADLDVKQVVLPASAMLTNPNRLPAQARRRSWLDMARRTP